MRRHPLDPASLVSGVAFVVIALAFLVGDLSSTTGAKVVWPVLLVAVGVGLLLAGWQRRGAADVAAERAEETVG